MATPKRQHTSFSRLLLIAVMLVLPLVTLTSCEKDEPDWLVGYYMTINSQVKLTLTEEYETEGSTALPEADVLSNTIVKMRTALLLAYPQKNRYGNDGAVIAALDDIFMEYKSMYHASEKNAVCIVKLYRASMDGDIVKKSNALKTYRFGARPVTEDGY